MKEKNNMMTSNRVFSVLQYLDRSDRRRFAKFMVSPFFNQSKPLTRLADFFLEQIELGNKEFDKQIAFSTISENGQFEDVLFRKYCSDLLGLVEDFFAHEQLEKNQIQKKIATIDSIRERKIVELFDSLFSTTKKNLDADKLKSSRYYFNEYRIERSFYEMKELEKGIQKFNVENIFDNLDLFYFIEKIKYFATVLSQGNVVKHDYKINFMDPILVFLKNNTVLISPVLDIYYKSLLTIIEPENEGHYFQLKEQLFTNSKLLESDEAVNQFFSAMNYCIKKGNQGKTEFNEEYFQLAEKGLELNNLTIGGEINTWQFNNIVVIALRVNKADWAEAFIQNHKHNLSDLQRQNTVAFCLSRVYWYQKKFDRVLEISRDVDFIDFNYNLISKTLILYVYYEQKEFEALYSFMDAFKVYLNRHKEIPTDRKKTYKNLIGIVNKFTKLNPKDKKEIEILRTTITESNDLPRKDWLLEKLDEIKLHSK